MSNAACVVAERIVSFSAYIGVRAQLKLLSQIFKLTLFFFFVSVQPYPEFSIRFDFGCTKLSFVIINTGDNVHFLFLFGTGVHCVVDIDFCKDNHCNPNGTNNCTNLQHDYLCYCLQGFSGRYCEVRLLHLTLYLFCCQYFIVF